MGGEAVGEVLAGDEADDQRGGAACAVYQARRGETDDDRDDRGGVGELRRRLCGPARRRAQSPGNAATAEPATAMAAMRRIMAFLSGWRGCPQRRPVAAKAESS